MRVTITPRIDEETGRPMLGVALGWRKVFRTVDPGTAAANAVLLPWMATVRTFEVIGSMIERRDTSDVQSVPGMAKMLADSIEEAPQQYVWLLIQISIALGLFNLLPIPALDGGRLTFLTYELVTRRRANEKAEAAIHTVGLVVLLGLIVLVVMRDFMRIVG
jgi:regulator of sigma E protease